MGDGEEEEETGQGAAAVGQTQGGELMVAEGKQGEEGMLLKGKVARGILCWYLRR